MTDGFTAQFRISPAVFAEYSLFAAFRGRRYRLRRRLPLAAGCVAAAVCAVCGFAFSRPGLMILGGVLLLCTFMFTFLFKKFVAARYRALGKLRSAEYTVCFSSAGMTVSALGKTESYGAGDIKAVYDIHGAYAVSLGKGQDFIIPKDAHGVDEKWLRRKFGSRYSVCR